MSAVKTKRSFGQWLRGYTGQKYTTTFLFLLIPLALLIVFTLIPAVNMVIYSFQDREMLGFQKWVGFDNYARIFGVTSSTFPVANMDFMTPLFNSLYYLVGSFLQQIIALFLATILCSKIKLGGLFKGFMFFPYLMNGVAVAIIFKNFFGNGDGVTAPQGTLNSMIQIFAGQSFEGIPWISDPTNPFMANVCLVFASIWRYVGFDIIMYISAIQSITPDVYEAADLDGANSWQRFWYIVFPSIRPIVSLQLIMAVKGAVSVFEIPFIITKGGFGTSTFVIKANATAFEDEMVGLACAMSVVLLIITLIVTAIQKIAFKERK